MENPEQLDWSPERKVVGAAVAVILTALVIQFTGVETIPGLEGAIGILVAYFLPNKKN